MELIFRLKGIFSAQKLSFYLVIILPTIVSLVINALLGKVIAIYLDPSTFGLYSLQFVIFSLVNSIFFIPLVNAYKTYRQDFPSELALKFFDTLIAIASLLTAAGLFTLFFWSSSIFTPGVILIISALLFIQGLFSLRLSYIQLTSDFKGHGWFTVLNATLNLLLLWSLTALANQKTHVSVWLAILIASTISYFAIRQNMKGSRIELKLTYITDSELVQKMKLFLWPLMVVAFLNSINNNADRYIIQSIMTTREVGIYAAGYGLGSKLLFLMTPILVYLTPIVYNNIKTNPFIVFRTIHKVLVFHTFLGLISCAVLYWLKDIIGTIFLSDQYRDSFILIPWVGLGFIFYNAVFAIETVFYATGKSKIILMHNALGAFINITANLIFIPFMGILGAAVASIISFFIQFLYCYYMFHKLRLSGL